MTRLSDNEISMFRYRQHAADYDASARITMPLRERAVALLELKPGETVLDVGAGTGLSYALLQAGVGPDGQVLAFEQSPDMFALAQKRAQTAAWPNLWHVCCPAESVQLPRLADAVLFNYVHDISRTPAAVANIMRFVRPGAKVAMAGMKYFPWWTGPLNLLAWLKNRPYNARAADLWAPWDIVLPYTTGMLRETTQWGMGYIAHGKIREHPP